MRGKLLFVAVLVLFVAAATGERPDEVKSSRSDKVSHYEVLGKLSVPQQINYQGYLTDDAGNAITDTVEMTFSIWDAASEGSQLWNETQASVSVVNGLFNVLLGSITSIPSDIFTGSSLWLQTQVGTEILSPRKAIVSVGHAFRASVADAADYADEAAYADTTDYAQNAGSAKRADTADYAVYVDSVGAVGPHDHAGETWTGDGIGTGLTFEDFGIGLRVNGTDTAIIAYSPTAPAIVAISGDTTGGKNRSGSDKATILMNGDGTLMGISRTSLPAVTGSSEKGIGIQGHSSTNHGIFGSSETYTGVWGQSNEGNGVEGRTISGKGVSGTSASGAGVYGTSSSGAGVDGWSTTGSGVSGTSASGYGVEGKSTSGNGVYGYSSTGIGGNFYSNESYGIMAGSNVGKAAKFYGNVDVTKEVYARSFHTVKTCYQHPPGGGGKALGAALQDTVITSAIDSLGNASFNFIEADSINTIDIYSLWGIETPRTGNGTNHFDNIGIRFADTNGVLMGFWNSITGDFFTEGESYVEGTKTAVVHTSSYGQRKLYVDESAEVYFFDRGQAQLLNGEVTIQLDPMFLETVTIDDNHPMLVQITLTADCNGVFVSEQTESSFTVKELMSGTSNATFNWEVAAKRKGYEDERLEEFTQVSR